MHRVQAYSQPYSVQAELEDKERKHFRTKGGSDFEGTNSCFLLSHKPQQFS